MDENRYEYAGLNPNATNTRGYECGKCGYEPTERELDNGTCPGCFEAKRAARLAKVYKPGDKVRERFREEILTVECMDVKQDDEGDRIVVCFTDGTYAYPNEIYPV